MIELEKRINLIREHPSFSTLREDEMADLAKLCFETSFQPGEIIVEQEELVDSIYLIVNGEIEVNSKIVEGNDVKLIPQAVLRGGDAIGLSQFGFFSQTGLRTATLTAITSVTLISWALDIFHYFLETHPEFHKAMKKSAQKMLRMNFIKKSTSFVDLPMSTIKKLAEEIEERFLSENEIVFNQGDEAEECYLICSGGVEIFIKGKSNERKVLAELEPSQLFGESALLTSAKRNASARMMESGKLLVLKRQQLEELMIHHNTSESIMALIIEHSRPTQAENIEHYHRKNDEGVSITILKDKKRGHYYQLSQEGWFIWEQLDGHNNLQDITIALYKKFNLFAPEAVVDTLLNLADAGFAVLPEVHQKTSTEPIENLSRWQKLKRAFYPWRYFQYIFYNVDPKLKASYDAGIHLFFSKIGQIFMAAFTLVGIFLFLFFLKDLPLRIPPVHHIIFLLIGLFIANLFLTIFHELAHGFTTKYFNHEVHRAGVIFSYFGLAAFVDTSDMWLSSRWPRIVVSFSGPYMDLFMGGIFAILAFFTTSITVAFFFWLLALTLYLSVIKNLNPLRENDGYYILKDALKENYLQSLAYEFLRHFDICHPIQQIRARKKESVYWLICLGFLSLNLLLAWMAQQYLSLMLPKMLLGIPTFYWLWLLPLFLIGNFVFTLMASLRK